MSAETENKVMFRGVELTANKAGYRGDKSIYTNFMKDEGIPEGTLVKVLDANTKLHTAMLDFCAERAIEEDRDVDLALTVSSGVTLDAGVQQRMERPGIPKKVTNEDGTVTLEPTDKVIKFGRCHVGMTYNLGKSFEDQKSRIASEVESAWTKKHK